jgi:FSR family fosmidomycin resistance protein-like MFS transporter
MNKWKIYILALGHGLNDCIAGYFLGCLALMQIEPLQIGIGVTLYNLLAFGGQYPVALWLEKSNTPGKFISISYGLNIIALVVFYFFPQLAIILAGIASALYHVAGGSACAVDNKAFRIGIFAAPGVLGLIAGGLLAWNRYNITTILLLLSVIIFLCLIRLRIENKIHSTETNKLQTNKSLLDKHDLLMIVLLLIISLRSAVWNIFQLIYENNYSWLIAIGISAFIGKIAGGWLADKIGWRLYTFLSLVLSSALLTIAKREWLLICIGIGLMQSGIPATTSLIIQTLKGKTARGIGLSFGLAIIIGVIPVYFSPFTVNSNIPILFILSFLLMMFFIYKTRNKIFLYP